MPTPPSAPYRASARDRWPSFALHESVNSQKTKRRRADPELAAVVANCDAIEEEVEDPEPLKKVTKKKEMNRNFFNMFTKTGTLEIYRTSFLFSFVLIAKSLSLPSSTIIPLTLTKQTSLC